MIEFRRRKTLVENLVTKAIDHLNKEGVPYNIITPEDADRVSKVNSRAMVLVSYIRNENGYYQIQVQDKELYNYTQKLLRDIFRLRITNIDKKNRVITAECDHFGIAQDVIEILGRKYNLSIVK